MQDFNLLAETISTMNGVKEFNMEPGYWQDPSGDEIPVHLLIIHHTLDSFKDDIYGELLDEYPDNTDEYDEEEDCYVSTFIISSRT
jgi:hypothetical protein